MGKDYYKVLDIPRDASLDVIKDAYRELAKQYHPDKTALLGIELRELASRKMLELNEAIQVLSNPRSRKGHDEELMKAEAGAPDATTAPAAAAPAAASTAKSAFWRDLERIEAERRVAEEAAQAAQAARAAQPTVEAEKAKGKRASAKVTRNIVLDFVDKFQRAVLQSAGGKWRREEPPGWDWVLESRDWLRTYLVAYFHLETLGMLGLKRVLSRAEALREQKQGLLKQAHFLFVVSYDRLMDSSQVTDTCRTWAAESRRDAQRLIVLLDGSSLASQFFGFPEDERMRVLVQLLSPRGK